MDDPALLSRLSKLEEEAARFREKEAKARAKAEKLERKIARIKGVEPSRSEAAEAVADVAEHPKLSGVAAIRAVLADEPGRVWSAAEVNAVIEARGWASPTARHRLPGIEASISRLVRGGELVRVERGRYVLAAEPGPASDPPIEGL